jgi:ABC-type polar amino acid transport system ATPase subunit
VIRVDALTKKFDGEPVLQGVSFELPTGGLGAILGGSGAGKTTLLRCLVGLESFDAGSIRIDDVEVVAAATTAQRRVREAALEALHGRIGLVFQSFELFPHLTVLENCVLAPMKVKKTPRDEAEAAATALLKQLGLGGKLAAWPDRLSGGQRQRVAIARAMAMHPRVLLYDEPTSALDPSLRHEIRATLRRVQETGVTQIVVTHDVSLAREATDRVFTLEKGRILDEAG